MCDVNEITRLGDTNQSLNERDTVRAAAYRNQQSRILPRAQKATLREATVRAAAS